MIKKTYKREMAVILIGFLLACVLYTMIGSTSEIQVKMIEILSPFIFGFAALAFGMDWYGKQINERSKRNGFEKEVMGDFDRGITDD